MPKGKTGFQVIGNRITPSSAIYYKACQLKVRVWEARTNITLESPKGSEEKKRKKSGLLPKSQTFKRAKDHIKILSFSRKKRSNGGGGGVEGGLAKDQTFPVFSSFRNPSLSADGSFLLQKMCLVQAPEPCKV